MTTHNRAEPSGRTSRYVVDIAFEMQRTHTLGTKANKTGVR